MVEKSITVDVNGKPVEFKFKRWNYGQRNNCLSEATTKFNSTTGEFELNPYKMRELAILACLVSPIEFKTKEAIANLDPDVGDALGKAVDELLGVGNLRTGSSAPA